MTFERAVEGGGPTDSVPLDTPSRRSLKVLTAGNMREALARGLTCGQCKHFDRDGVPAHVVKKMFEALRNDDKWQERWHDPKRFGYCRGALKRTAVEITAQACEEFRPLGFIASFVGKLNSR